MLVLTGFRGIGTSVGSVGLNIAMMMVEESRRRVVNGLQAQEQLIKKSLISHKENLTQV
jgi:hypothetical protein